MEYSVYDLIRILLKKWYVILAAMVLIAGLSVVTSQRSYQQAEANYEAFTTPPAAVTAPTGDTVAQYCYSYRLTDVSRYLAETRTKDAFYQAYAEAAGAEAFDQTDKPSIYDEAARALTLADNDFAALLSSNLTMREAQTALDNASVKATLSSCLTVERITGSTLQLTVTGLNEETANTVLDTYLTALKTVALESSSMEITAEQTYHNYYAVTTQDTSVSNLSQTVMKEPTQAPSIVKPAVTAAMYAFVLACFLILLVTFIKDSRRGEQTKKTAKETM